MTRSLPVEAFELFADFSEVSDETHDAVLATFPGHEELWLQTIPPQTAKLPDEVWFWASLERARHLDFLRTDVGWVVCSRRMLESLRKVGTFPHQAIPAHLREADQDRDGTLEGEFVVLAVTQATDALDLQASDLARRADGSIRWVRKWAFKKPPGGLPPVFRVNEDESRLLISQAAKTALETAGFKGIEIKPRNRIGTF